MLELWKRRILKKNSEFSNHQKYSRSVQFKNKFRKKEIYLHWIMMMRFKNKQNLKIGNSHITDKI